jgi:hypothetical protein
LQLSKGIYSTGYKKFSGKINVKIYGAEIIHSKEKLLAAVAATHYHIVILENIGITARAAVPIRPPIAVKQRFMHMNLKML